MLALAREIVASGEIGEVASFRGVHAEDYMADAVSALHLAPRPDGRPWRRRRSRQPHHLDRPLRRRPDRLAGRPDGDCGRGAPGRAGRQEMRKVEVDDEARALVRFAKRRDRSLEASWVATGRKMQLAFEVTGSKGSISSTTSGSTSCSSTRPARRPAGKASRPSTPVPSTPSSGVRAWRPAIISASTISRPSRSGRSLTALAGGPRSCPSSAKPTRSSAWSTRSLFGPERRWVKEMDVYANRRTGRAISEQKTSLFTRDPPRFAHFFPRNPTNNKTIEKLADACGSERSAVVQSFIGTVHRDRARLHDNSRSSPRFFPSDPGRLRDGGGATVFPDRPGLRIAGDCSREGPAPTAWRSSRS